MIKLISVNETLADETWSYTDCPKNGTKETLSKDITFLSIGTLSEEYINCGVILFILDHYISNHNFCYHGTVELANVN